MTSTQSTHEAGKQEISPCQHEIRNILLQEANYDIHDPSKTRKRQDYLGWDQYFMSLSLLSAQRSKDPNVQMGACIVDSKNRIVGIGYNGFPRGCSDDCLPWASSHDLISKGGANAQIHEVGNAAVNVLHTRDAYMCRAEVNAILNKCSENLEESRMYVPELPCKSQGNHTFLKYIPQKQLLTFSF
jgi:deoxycytidylate deaminase